VLDTEQWLDRYRSGDLHTRTLSWEEVSVVDHGIVAIAVGKQTQEATYQGRPSNGEFRVSHIFARQADRGRLVGMHVSKAVRPQRP
jgi:ketosteroid isomerase-like protein